MYPFYFYINHKDWSLNEGDVINILYILFIYYFFNLVHFKSVTADMVLNFDLLSPTHKNVFHSLPSSSKEMLAYLY